MQQMQSGADAAAGKNVITPVAAVKPAEPPPVTPGHFDSDILLDLYGDVPEASAKGGRDRSSSVGSERYCTQRFDEGVAEAGMGSFVHMRRNEVSAMARMIACEPVRRPITDRPHFD
jgi:hypothetical protein